MRCHQLYFQYKVWGGKIIQTQMKSVSPITITQSTSVSTVREPGMYIFITVILCVLYTYYIFHHRSLISIISYIMVPLSCFVLYWILSLRLIITILRVQGCTTFFPEIYEKNFPPNVVYRLQINPDQMLPLRTW